MTTPGNEEAPDAGPAKQAVDEGISEFVQASRALERALAAQTERVTRTDAALSELRREMAEVKEMVDQLREGMLSSLELGSHESRLGAARFDRLVQILDLIRSEEPEMRRRLFALREQPEYRVPYSDPDPLVSVIIPTYMNWEGLRDRALASILNQTHSNLEVLVVGDAAPPETAATIAAIGDPRVRYINNAIRGPYPDDPEMKWCIKGTFPLNTGVGAARGQWLCLFADDDILRPYAIATMLDFMRSGGHEFGYGRLLAHRWDGEVLLLGTFPPHHGGQGLQGCLIHAGLQFMYEEPGDALFGVPSDWALTQRMMRIGVRIGYCEEILGEYYWTQPPQAGGEAQ